MIFIKNTLEEYLSSNNVVIEGKYFKGNKTSNIEEHLNLLESVHDILKLYKYDGSVRVNCTIGKILESTNVKIKKLRYDLAIRKNNSFLNDMDKFILKQGDKILLQGEVSLYEIKKINYRFLIKRAMKNNEICIGRCDEANLTRGEKIKLGSLKNISYNLVEEDIYDYLKRVSRKDKRIDFSDILNCRYINILGDDSRRYIELLLKIPQDSYKQWNRYINNKRNISYDEYLNNILKSIGYEMGD